MKNNNLEVAPTEQELYNAGFKEDIFGCLSIRLSKYLKIVVALDDNVCTVIGQEVAEKISFTKQKINDAFALFNQPLPQWEKKRPKVGEVWRDDETVYLINDGVLNNTIRVTILFDSLLPTGAIMNILPDTLTKLAENLDDYFINIRNSINKSIKK